MTSEGPTPPADGSESEPPADATATPPPPTPPEPTPPSATPPVVPAAHVGPPPATPPVVGEPINTGMSGCAKAAIIGGVIIVVLGLGLVAVVTIGIIRFGDNIEETFSEEPCEFMTNAEASAALGSDVEATSGESGFAEILGLIQDTRLLSDAPSCFISGEDSAVQVWISVYDGGDAAEVFGSWAAVADGEIVSQATSESGTLTVETDAFRGEDVPGLGEEAFCVDVGFAASGGVFARSDSRVVYVTVLALEENQGAEVFDASTCERAVPVAEALLG